MNISIFKKRSIKENRIPESKQRKYKQKDPVGDKKDQKEKGKLDARVKSVNEEDYSKIKELTNMLNMSFEFNEIDHAEADKIKKNLISTYFV